MSHTIPRGEHAADIETFRQRLLAALLAADRDAAEAVIDDALSDGTDGIAILDDVVSPVMRQIGGLWANGEISVTDEHRATVVAHATLGRIYPNLVTAEPRSRGRVLLAGAEGEEHVFGLRMIADVLEGCGFDVRNVGGGLAPDVLASAVRRHRPVLVGLADTMGGVSALSRSIAAVRSVDPSLPMLVGGAGATAAAGLAERCEVCASARGAREAAERLLGLS